jgi:hypothetical protein
VKPNNLILSVCLGGGVSGITFTNTSLGQQLYIADRQTTDRGCEGPRHRARHCVVYVSCLVYETIILSTIILSACKNTHHTRQATSSSCLCRPCPSCRPPSCARGPASRCGRATSSAASWPPCGASPAARVPAHAPPPVPRSEPQTGSAESGAAIERAVEGGAAQVARRETGARAFLRSIASCASRSIMSWLK